jgi:hypothetical protein
MRGRPAGRMTPRRLRVLETLVDAAQRGEHISLAKIARKCGLTDYRNARRIREDLRRMGAI